MSAFDFLFQGSPPPSITTGTTSETGLPDWYQSLMLANVGRADAAASQPYQAYPGPQVAPFSQAQNQAFSTVQNNVGSYQPDFNTAGSAYSGVANGGGALNQAALNSYMNPYMSDVVNQIQTLGNRNLMENVLPGVNDTFTGAGQFGGSRNADFTGRAIRDNQQSISNAQGQALSTGFQNAASSALAGQGQALTAASGLGALGQAQQQAGLTDAAALNQIGTQQQQNTQQNYNAAMQNFATQQNWPYAQASYMNDIIRGLPTGQSTAATSTGPYSVYSPSPLATAAGLATGAAGAGQMSGLGSIINGLG